MTIPLIRRRFSVALAVAGALVVSTFVVAQPARAASIPSLSQACQPLVAGTPTVTSLTLSPGTVDVTHATGKVTVTVKAVDTGSINDVRVAIAPPTGAHVSGGFVLGFDLVLSRSAGTTSDGTWTGTATIPRYAAPGTWQVSELVVADRGGGRTTYGRSDTPWGSGWTTTFAVSDATPDRTTPVLKSLTLSSRVISTVHGTKWIGVTARVTDGRSGVAKVSVKGLTVSNLHRESGTSKDGVYRGAMRIPAWLGTGWHGALLSVVVQDSAGNYRRYGAPELKSLGAPSSLLVLSGADGVRGKLTGLSVSAKSVDARTSSRPVVVLLEAADALAGISTVSVTLEGHQYYAKTYRVSLHSGTPQSGTWRGTLLIPQCSMPGTWSIQVLLTDAAGNRTQYFPSALRAKGLQSSLAVKAIDFQPPAPRLLQPIGPAGPIRVSFNQPTLWRDGTAQTALQVTDGATSSSVPGTWTCVGTTGAAVTCDADGADVVRASFAPATALTPNHLYFVDPAAQTIYDTVGNAMVATGFRFTTGS
jgi:hypothetical protein